MFSLHGTIQQFREHAKSCAVFGTSNVVCERPLHTERGLETLALVDCIGPDIDLFAREAIPHLEAAFLDKTVAMGFAHVALANAARQDQNDALANQMLDGISPRAVKDDLNLGARVHNVSGALLRRQAYQLYKQGELLKAQEINSRAIALCKKAFSLAVDAFDPRQVSIAVVNGCFAIGLQQKIVPDGKVAMLDVVGMALAGESIALAFQPSYALSDTKVGAELVVELGIGYDIALHEAARRAVSFGLAEKEVAAVIGGPIDSSFTWLDMAGSIWASASPVVSMRTRALLAFCVANFPWAGKTSSDQIRACSMLLASHRQLSCNSADTDSSVDARLLAFREACKRFVAGLDDEGRRCLDAAEAMLKRIN